MRKLIVIPTYNEKENITLIVDAVLGIDPQVEILVADDNSPDGTGKIVDEMKQSRPRLHHLARKGKEGLGKAYLAGFAWGLEQGFDVISEMDADFSHRPEDLKVLLEEIEKPENDFIVGSRWVDGGGTINWGLLRKIISRGGSFYTRCILHHPVRDWTGGFNVWKKEVLQGIDLATVESEGYSFQIELKYRALKNGFKGKEIPILFEDRRLGQSKMSLAIVLEALYRVWMIRFA